MRTVFRIWLRLWMTLMETSFRQILGYCVTVSAAHCRKVAYTHVVNDILLAQVVDLSSSFNTSGPATAYNEAQQAFPFFRSRGR